MSATEPAPPSRNEPAEPSLPPPACESTGREPALPGTVIAALVRDLDDGDADVRLRAAESIAGVGRGPL